MKRDVPEVVTIKYQTSIARFCIDPRAYAMSISAGILKKNTSIILYKQLADIVVHITDIQRRQQ